MGRVCQGELEGPLDMPPIFCPLDSRVNPARDRVDERAIDWFDGLGLAADPPERARVLRTHSADFYARFAPFAGEDGLLVAVLWVYWGFAFDDARSDVGYYSTRPEAFLPMAARVQRALEITGTDDDFYARSLGDFGARLRSVATPVQVRRFIDAHRAWLWGAAWQIANQARGRTPSLEDYLTMRLHSAGGEPTFALLEVANGAEVPAEEMDSPEVRALTELAIMTASLDNDRHSLNRELAVSDKAQNIYTVLREHGGGGSLRAAVEEAARLRDRVFCRFLRLRERLAPRLSTPGRCYVDGLAYGVRGNAEWGLRVPRYITGELSPADPAPSAITWADAPLDDGTEPIDLPTTAWWWTV